FEDQGKVEYSMRGAPFQARLNFNIELGDTLNVRDFYRSNDSIPYATRYISVIDTFFLEVGARQLLSKEIEYRTVYTSGRSDWIRFDTLVRYLGFLNQYIDPDDAGHRAVDGGEGGFLRCYSNDELGVVQSPIRGNVGYYRYDCGRFDVVTSNRNSITPNVISSYPNPVLDAWQIDHTGHKLLDANLIDVNGKKLFQFQLKPGKNEFSIGELPAGLYFLMIEGETVEKVLKQ
ncbi:MAG: T9SS type A sorting domain-containing protein, partial [Bacteroidota bacterium]